MIHDLLYNAAIVISVGFLLAALVFSIILGLAESRKPAPKIDSLTARKEFDAMAFDRYEREDRVRRAQERDGSYPIEAQGRKRLGMD